MLLHCITLCCFLKEARWHIWGKKWDKAKDLLLIYKATVGF